jgi:hypothetical protein
MNKQLVINQLYTLGINVDKDIKFNTANNSFRYKYNERLPLHTLALMSWIIEENAILDDERGSLINYEIKENK